VYKRQGCTCVLDIPKDTQGIQGGGHPNFSVALFGGIEKVIFARTKYGLQRHTAVNAFNDDDNYKETTLQGSGVVRCLGFSRNFENQTTKGYFLAGTDNGLYVYTDDNDQGFDGNNGLTTLQAAPFDAPSNFTWKRIAENLITGPVTSIECDGFNIYIVEQDITTQGGITSKLWKFPLTNDTNTMVAAVNVPIAQSDSGDIPTNTIFTGFRLVTNRIGQNARAGILSTNKGIYRSIPDLTAVTLASNWEPIDETQAYHSLYSPKRTPTAADLEAGRDGVNHKVWGIALADDDRELNYYQNSRFYQFNTNAARTNITLFANAGYTSGDLLAPATSPTYLDRSLYFWSDGARRFYTRFNADETVYNALRSLPYYGAEWAMTEPHVFSELLSITRIHWIENISGLGIVLAGTDTGVISLVE